MEENVLNQKVQKLAGRSIMTNACAPVDLLMQHGSKPHTALTCPICGNYFKVQEIGGFTLWRATKSCEIPVSSGPVNLLTSDDCQSRGVALDLECELGHVFHLHITQILLNHPLTLDLIPADETYEQFEDQLYEEGRNG